MNRHGDDERWRARGPGRFAVDPGTVTASPVTGSPAPTSGRAGGGPAAQPPRREPLPREIADRAADAIRILNHATFPGAAAYESPADVSAVIGSLASLFHGLPQSLRQAARWLADAHARGVVRDVEAATETETAQAVCTVIIGLSDAATHAGRAADRLRDAHIRASRLAAVDVDEPIPFLPADAP